METDENAAMESMSSNEREKQQEEDSDQKQRNDQKRLQVEGNSISSHLHH